MPASTTRENSAARTAAIKRLLPGAPGTKRLVACFCDALLCVRYRHDPLRNCRLTTVELVIEERPAKPEKTAWIRVAYGKTELRQRIKEAGGAWHRQRKLWLLPLSSETRSADGGGCLAMDISGCPAMEICIHIWQQIARYGFF